MTTGEDSTHSGLSLLDGSIRERLGAGRLGVIAARAGVGKTALLTHIALAQLLEERPVLHVALDRPVNEVRGLYDRMFDEAARRGLLDGSDTHRMQLERRRHIHYFRQGFAAEKLDEALRFLAAVMEFSPHTVVLDGFPLEVASHEAVSALRDVALAAETRIWLSALTHRHETEGSQEALPKPLDGFDDLLDVVLCLAPDKDRVLLRVLKDTGNGPAQLPLRFDPATTLLAVED